MPSKAEVARVRQRVEQARRKSLPESLFPKLVERFGSAPRIKDAPPLIFHPTAEQAPGVRTGYVEALEGYRKSLPEHIRVLFDRFRLFDLAIKVVGVGSVGTYCALGLFMAADDDPIFLQVKEARKSVLEPYAGKSVHGNHGERVVAGQRLMQAASDIFLGWTRGVIGRDYYFRQLRDAKISAIPEGWDLTTLNEFGKLCAWALARAHARSGDPARIAGYMGSNTTFDDAVCEFAVEYADQKPSRLSPLCQSDPRGSNPGRVRGLSLRRPKRFRSRPIAAETGRSPAGLLGAPSSCPRRRTARLR